MRSLEVVGQSAPQTRRQFCAGACRAMSVLGVAALVPGCGGGGSPSAPSPGGVPALSIVTASVGNGTATLSVDAGSPLATVGGAALVQTTSRTLLVARTAPDSFMAFTAICTHEACTITRYQNQRFVCPCHGSEFDTSGRPVSGPANRALQQSATSFAGDVLTIAL